MLPDQPPPPSPSILPFQLSGRRYTPEIFEPGTGLMVATTSQYEGTLALASGSTRCALLMVVLAKPAAPCSSAQRCSGVPLPGASAAPAAPVAARLAPSNTQCARECRMALSPDSCGYHRPFSAGVPAKGRARNRFGSVPDGKAPVEELGLFDLIDHGHGIVFHRDGALPFLVSDYRVSADAELAGAGARGDAPGRAEEGPGHVLHVREQPVQRIHRGGHLAIGRTCRTGVDDALALGIVQA